MILRGLMDVPDYEIFKSLMRGNEKNSFMEGCIKYMLRQLQSEKIFSRNDVLNYIGSRFRVKLMLPEWYTHVECAEFLFKHSLFTHLDTNEDKFHLLIFMLRKLYALVHQNSCKPDDPDSPMMQEILLPGHLYLGVLSERLQQYLVSMKTIVQAIDARKPYLHEQRISMIEACKRESPITNSMEYFLATGNLVSKHGLGILQSSGFSIIADKLNYMRYLSHFRSVHRGAVFTEIRTTSVRKLTPESWGFLCPVHTPDGSLCGLLNHLAFMCEICVDEPNNRKLVELLKSLGMISIEVASLNSTQVADLYEVFLNGKLLGFANANDINSMASKLRYLKTLSADEANHDLAKGVSKYMEICVVPSQELANCSYTLYPGLYLFTSPGRLVRPVRNLQTNTVEYIGTMEQCYLHICVKPEEFVPERTTHQEIYPYSFMSVVANLTPFSEFNQSPRNMYQCQMGKQTMGTPCHSIHMRTDNKLYRINFPQSPLVRTKCYDYFQFDDYPVGTNAIVAVISYTGYDMEDAMILNKSSFERGFAHGTVYTTEIVELNDKSGAHKVFALDPKIPRLRDTLDSDGLPYVGAVIQPGDPFYCYLDTSTGEYRVQSFKKLERAYVESVRALGSDDGTEPLCKVAIMISFNRNPIIGDKFSSRHGQKGICSRIYPTEDLPFTESGLTPDIIFNPHGFPSRMTIGMMIEFMAGKTGALYGTAHDATPFQFDQNQSAIDYYGKLLQKAGYSYYGTESMYSGIHGRQLEVDIFFGVVYYQRLRHMVSDKFQVRTTGPIDIRTHQPVKGRKREGGIRFGEMERDALLAHGTAAIIQDRLLNCSDKTAEQICTKCASFISISKKNSRSICLLCGSSDSIAHINVPYVLKYLVAELASSNIRVKFETSQAVLTNSSIKN